MIFYAPPCALLSAINTSLQRSSVCVLFDSVVDPAGRPCWMPCKKIGMRFRRNRQRWATEILKATKGEDLTRLKAYVDDGGVLSTS